MRTEPDNITIHRPSGYGGHGMPEQLLVALERRFVDTGAPKGLTLMHATGQGDAKDKGLNLLAHEGLRQRVIRGSKAAR